MRVRRYLCVSLILLAGLTETLRAQSAGDGLDLLGRRIGSSDARLRPEAARPEAWGVAADAVETITGLAFVPAFSSIALDQEGGTGRRLCLTGSPCLLNADLNLPPGAQVTAIELDGCDDDATEDVTFALIVCPGFTGNCVIHPSPSGAKTSGSPGCGRFSVAIPSGPIVDRRNDTQYAAMSMAATPNHSFRALRVFYRLRLSEGPAVPSFGDVPATHLFYRHIEALFASGITSGCGNGNFCPGQPVTRGEMAAFLAKALGLYFPF